MTFLDTYTCPKCAEVIPVETLLDDETYQHALRGKFGGLGANSTEREAFAYLSRERDMHMDVARAGHVCASLKAPEELSVDVELKGV